MTEVKEKEQCVNCNELLPICEKAEERKPCHNCGSTGRKRTIEANEKIVIKQSGQIEHKGEKRKSSYPLLIISFAIVWISTLSVYYTTNSEFSVIIGIILGFVAWYVGRDSEILEKFHFREKF